MMKRMDRPLDIGVQVASDDSAFRTIRPSFDECLEAHDRVALEGEGFDFGASRK